MVVCACSKLTWGWSNLKRLNKILLTRTKLHQYCTGSSLVTEKVFQGEEGWLGPDHHPLKPQPLSATWRAKRKQNFCWSVNYHLQENPLKKKTSVSYYNCTSFRTLLYYIRQIFPKIPWPKKVASTHVIFGWNNDNLAVDALLVNLQIVWYQKNKKIIILWFS